MKEKVNSIGICSLVVALTGAPFWGILSSYILYQSKTFTFLSMIIGFIISLFISKIFLIFYNIEPSLSITEKFKKIFKKYSIIINILFILLSLSLYILLTYRLTSFLSTQYIIDTPKIVFHIMILFLTYYISSKGSEVLTRLSIISLFIAIAVFTLDATSLLQFVKLDNYLPLYSPDYINIIKSSLIFSVFFSVPTLYINIVKKSQIVDYRSFKKKYYFMYILSFVTLLLSNTITLGVYGSSLVTVFDYPLYTVLNKIVLFSFLDSIENISVILWILYIINASSTILLTTINTVKETFNTNNKIVYLIIFLITLIVPTILFMNNRYIEMYKYIFIPTIVCVSITIIIFFTLLIYKNKSN